MLLLVFLASLVAAGPPLLWCTPLLVATLRSAGSGLASRPKTPPVKYQRL